MAKDEDQISREAYAIKEHIDAAEAKLTDANFTPIQKHELRSAFREIGKAIVKAI